MKGRRAASPADAAPALPAAATGDAERRRAHGLRGSSLLLAGRLLSKFVNFGIQVALVRLLSQEDFGVFAFGLGLVIAGELIVKLGVGRGANRFVPLYFERGDHAHLMGTLALACTTIALMSVLGGLALLWLFERGIGPLPHGDGARIVLVLALLVPVQALDTIAVQTLACFSCSRQIMLRKHVVGPLLKVAAVATAFFAGGESLMLAFAYVTGGCIGLALSAHLAVRQLQVNGVLPLAPRSWRLPGALVSFSLPLISSDLVPVALTAVTTALPLAWGSEADVALLRAVVPAAALNLLVLQSFALLFTPASMRLYAAGDTAGLAEHHWQSVAWVVVLSFPVFALTFGIAPLLVPWLLGAAYAPSAVLLAVLSLGHYGVVLLAFNAEALQVAGRTRVLLGVNFLIVATALVLAWLLIPRLGPLGAAASVSVACLTGAIVRQVSLARSGLAGRPSPAVRQVWRRVLVGALLIALVGWWWRPAPAVQVAVCVLVTLALLRTTAKALDVRTTFPELLRVPLMARLLPS